MKAIVGNPEGINPNKPTAVVIVGVELSELQHAFGLAGISMHEFPFSAFSGNPEGNEIVQRLKSPEGITILVTSLEDLENFRAAPEVLQGEFDPADLTGVELREGLLGWVNGDFAKVVAEASKDGGKPPSSST